MRINLYCLRISEDEEVQFIAYPDVESDQEIVTRAHMDAIIYNRPEIANTLSKMIADSILSNYVYEMTNESSLKVPKTPA